MSYYTINTSLGDVLNINETFTSRDDTLCMNVEWNIHNIIWILDNLTNREMSVVKPQQAASAAAKPENKNQAFEVKIKLLRKDNELLEIYYKPQRDALVSTELIYSSTDAYYSNYTITKPKIWAAKDQWHLAGLLFKSEIINKHNSRYDWSLFSKIYFITYNTKTGPILPVVYGPQINTNKHDLSTHLELIFVSKTLSDVTVRSVEGEEFPAHRALLAARSDVLRAHLEHDTVEKRTRIINTAFHADTIREILWYIYTDTVPNISETPNELLIAADFYLIKGLKELSANKLIEKLAIENAIKTLELAHLHSAPELKDQTLEFIHNSPKHEITETEGWKELKNVELLKNIYEYKKIVQCEGNNQSTEPDNEPRPNLETDLKKLLNKALSSDLSDTVIKSIDGQKLHSHRVILAARSEVFKAHFEHNEETSISTIESPFEANILQNILHFMYTDLVKADELSVKLLEATDFYQLEGLKYLCEEHLSENLNVDNAIEYLEHAEKYRAPYLMRHCLEYINHFGRSNDIIKTEGWKRLQSTELAKRLYECKIEV